MLLSLSKRISLLIFLSVIKKCYFFWLQSASVKNEKLSHILEHQHRLKQQLNSRPSTLQLSYDESMSQQTVRQSLDSVYSTNSRRTLQHSGKFSSDKHLFTTWKDANQMKRVEMLMYLCVKQSFQLVGLEGKGMV